MHNNVPSSTGETRCFLQSGGEKMCVNQHQQSAKMSYDYEYLQQPVLLRTLL